jgi:outer membrane receptor for ferrienterochelin and colicins
MQRTIVSAVLACCAVASHAHDGHSASNVTSTVGQAWDFTLPSLDGSRFVKASSFTGPVLVNFWGRDCPPCVAELPRLQAFAQAHPQWTVLLVSTDSPAITREFVQQHSITLPVLRPGANVTALMRSAGNRSGGLPFTVVVYDARICDRQSGMLQDSDLRRFEQACSAAISQKPRP